MEGIWRGIDFIGDEDTLSEFLDKFETIAPLALGLEDDVTEGKIQEVLENIKHYYFKTNSATEPEVKTTKVKSLIH